MKNIAKASLWLLLTGVMMFAAVGCGEQKKNSPESQMLVVERQQFRLTAHNPYVNKGIFAIDIPISGPQQLIDSLKVFMNNELYKDIEISLYDSVHFTEKEMYQDNLMGMMSYYEDKYKPFEEELEDPVSFNLFLIAQTESFVTYGIDCCGGRGAVFYCHTFSKKDGHKLGETITKTNLIRFMSDHPEIENPFSETGISDGDWAFFDLGLLEDEAICVNESWQNYYYAQKFDYKDLMPYLSKEAQELIKEKGTTNYSYESWLMGEQIGKVETTDHETIFLMYRPPLWKGFACFAGGPISADEDSVYDPFYQDKAYTLTAYAKKDGQYVMKDVFPTSRFEFEFPNWACSKPASFDDDEFFVYNEADNMLFVPYVTEAREVGFLSYKFNGQHFKPISPEETKPLGKVIGWVVSDSNDSICLVEGTNVESFSTNIGGIGLAAEGISAYYVRDHLYVPARIFPYQRNTLEFLPGDEPMVTSNPTKGFYAFDPKERKIYTVTSERTSLGGWGSFDRYDVFRFQGEMFVYEGEDGGFWLHPSLRQFGRLLYAVKTKEYLIRIDEMRIYDDRYDDQYEAARTDTCRYRYAVWNNKSNMPDVYDYNMLDKPDLVIYNGYRIDNGFVFLNDGYRYVIEFCDPDSSDESWLLVYKGAKLLYKGCLRSLFFKSILSFDWDYELNSVILDN